MLLSAEYVRWLEKLPCNRHARRRQQKHGQWLDGWVPDSSEQDALVRVPEGVELLLRTY